MLFRSLNEVAYGDDTQIVKLIVTKAYTQEQPRVQVLIEEIEDEEDDTV